MTKLRVFPDTGVLLSMAIFPVGQRGKPTLAGEVLGLYYKNFFDLAISQAVVEELLAVIQEEFSDSYNRVLAFLAPFTPQFSRKRGEEAYTLILKLLCSSA